jgi:hypothetical protein
MMKYWPVLLFVAVMTMVLTIPVTAAYSRNVGYLDNWGHTDLSRIQYNAHGQCIK